jgi:hypothetical protein
MQGPSTVASQGPPMSLGPYDMCPRCRVVWTRFKGGLAIAATIPRRPPILSHWDCLAA